ncbi:Ribose-phosphate diphosphokinase [Carpediemonas membranifera]|uniref:ribose-phosphate diphosphokinase n=1 Tax=Carpediemonas membranifera TaxID=201153 RepID=A0A8J6AYC8_9EUKA|nr:Ribose-phosphate diphosphokinase [Carpediemonas membranifera]|eukprot:KAG9394470.1 Ribose-phosphate diphosphokinase [Carpediemonas membranifera]
MTYNVFVASGTANEPLADAIVTELNKLHSTLDRDAGVGAADLQLPEEDVVRKLNMSVTHFADGEIQVKIADCIRGADVFVVQPISPPSVNDFLMELLIITDALKRASVGRVTAVIPYYGYARQERKAQPRAPITAKLVANLIQTAGVDRVLACDLHAAQIQGFFDIPLDHIQGLYFHVDYLMKEGIVGCPKDLIENIAIVSPDLGGAERAGRAARMLQNAVGATDEPDIVLIHKQRPRPNEARVLFTIGVERCRDRLCIIIDDIVDTGCSLVNAAGQLRANGAKDVICCITHGVLSRDAIHCIRSSEHISRLVITDTIRQELPPLGEGERDNITIISTAPWFASSIVSIHTETSLGSVFMKNDAYIRRL